MLPTLQGRGVYRADTRECEFSDYLRILPTTQWDPQGYSSLCLLTLCLAWSLGHGNCRCRDYKETQGSFQPCHTVSHSSLWSRACRAEGFSLRSVSDRSLRLYFTNLIHGNVSPWLHVSTKLNVIFKVSGIFFRAILPLCNLFSYFCIIKYICLRIFNTLGRCWKLFTTFN